MGGSREVSTPTGCSRKRMRLRLFGCGGWIKLEHGAKTIVLSGTCYFEKKSGCTVITVAHRIPTVMDCTMALAISDGKIVEYDEPMNVMKREGSLFGQLVKEYWSHFQSAGSH